MIYKLSNNITALGKVIIKQDKSFSFLSYLIQGEKNILIDTNPDRSALEYLKELNSLISINSLDAVILNHSEIDHSGALFELLKLIPNVPIYCTSNCKERLKGKLDSGNFKTVKDDEEIHIGNFDFKFIHTPGLHLDDNMVTYFINEKTLFSNDLFGQNLGSEIPLDTEFSTDLIIEKANEYFEKNFSDASHEQRQVIFKIADYDINCIAPGHGIVLKYKRNSILSLYKEKCK